MKIYDKYGKLLLETIGADLSDADLRGAKYNEYTSFFSLNCPEEGAFIGWKKVYDYIVKLMIPEDAKRSSATSRKCRCEKAIVLEIKHMTTGEEVQEIINWSHTKTLYKVGTVVLPDSWDDNRWNECSHGIHFFITRDEAVRY